MLLGILFPTVIFLKLRNFVPQRIRLQLFRWDQVATNLESLRKRLFPYETWHLYGAGQEVTGSLATLVVHPS